MKPYTWDHSHPGLHTCIVKLPDGRVLQTTYCLRPLYPAVEGELIAARLLRLAGYPGAETHETREIDAT